jgi:hypothetical protein
MQLEDGDPEEINIGAIKVEQQLPQPKERIKEQALLDEDYVAICRQFSSGGKIDECYEVKDDLLSWKGRLYVPKGLRKRVMNSEHDS